MKSKIAIFEVFNNFEKLFNYSYISIILSNDPTLQAFFIKILCNLTDRFSLWSQVCYPYFAKVVF